MQGMMTAPRAIFLAFNLVRCVLFIFRSAVIAPFAIRTLQLNNVAHRFLRSWFRSLSAGASSGTTLEPGLAPAEPTTGIEPVTPSLPRKCSTTELHGLMKISNFRTRFQMITWGGAMLDRTNLPARKSQTFDLKSEIPGWPSYAAFTRGQMFRQSRSSNRITYCVLRGTKTYIYGAGNGIRTRDPQLGRLML